MLGWNSGWAPCDDSTLTQRTITSILAPVERMILFLYVLLAEEFPWF